MANGVGSGEWFAPSRYQPPLPLDQLLLRTDSPGAGDRMDLDVLIVGAGPAGLACAIELANLATRAGTELNIGVLEKAASLGEHSLHPFLSRRFDDPLSILLLRSSTSLLWNVVALGALLATVALIFLGSFQEDPARSVPGKVLISYAVIGNVWNALAANAHSARSGSYGRGLLLFAIWPLSHAYNWRETLRYRRRGGVNDAA